MNYQILYDSTSYAFKAYLPTFIMLIFVIAGIFYLIRIKQGKSDYSRVGPILILTVGVIFLVLFGLKRIGEKKFIIQPYLAGNYNVVEGYPEELEGTDTSSGVDSFYIDGVYFTIGGTDGPGFQKRAYAGGPIDSENNYYRITYFTYYDSIYIFKVEMREE